MTAGGLRDDGQHLNRHVAIQHAGHINLTSIGALQHGSVPEQRVSVQVRYVERLVQCHGVGRGRLAFVASDAVLSILHCSGPESIDCQHDGERQCRDECQE